MDNATYYQRNREKILNKTKDYYKNNNKQEINIETYLKKIRIKIENTEKIDIIICLKKRSKNWKNIKNKDIEKQKSLNK